MGASEAELASTNAGATGLSQTGLAQSQRAVTQPQGESLSQLPESASRSVAEGLPADWDWEGYLRLNPDVATAVGTDAASAKLHWLTWGQAEKRPYKVSTQPFRQPFNQSNSWSANQPTNLAFNQSNERRWHCVILFCHLPSTEEFRTRSVIHVRRGCSSPHWPYVSWCFSAVQLLPTS